MKYKYSIYNSTVYYSTITVVYYSILYYYKIDNTVVYYGYKYLKFLNDNAM